jgi:YceI-like domain
MDASITLYTFKEGLLSKLAHDLRLSLTRFEIRARGTEISARFEPRSIRIDGVMKDGQLVRGEPSEGDQRKIQDNMLRDVLRASDYGEIKFAGRTASREPPFAIDGELTLCGVTRPLRALLALRGERLEGELELVPSQWGIKPFRALGGTLKVQDRVKVAIQASADWLVGGQELNPSVELVWAPNGRKPSVLRPSLVGR